jgi:flagellar protein FlaJ
MRIKLSKERKILLISLALSSFLLYLGFLSNDVGVIGNMIIISTFVIASPQLILAYLKYRELKDMEEKFPLFVRDLTESISSGMPFHEAIRAASKVSYGKLSKEIKKMANQISWGIPIADVLEQFANRVKKSRRLFSAIKIIKESYLAGGNVIATLDSVAKNVSSLEDAEKERKSILNQYVLVMYVISLIFVVIVVAINRLLLPIFRTTAIAEEVVGLTNPCLACEGISCNICSIFQLTSQYIFFLDPASPAAYYTSLFFFMSFIQSAFSGLIAGQISENSIRAGIKHSLILVSIIFGAFSILVRLGLMGV